MVLGTVSASNRRSLLFFSSTLCLLVVMSFMTSANRAPIATAETRFVEQSEGGMQIVPASCPSDPHASGDCDTPVQPGTGCTLYASPTTISPGEAANLHWSSVTDYKNPWTRTFSPDIGLTTVAWAGSWSVTPSVTTTYTLTGTRPVGGSGDPTSGSETWSCSATVTVNPPPPMGPPPPPASMSGSCSSDGTSASFSWPAVPGATGYYVRVDNQGNPYAPTRCDNGNNDGYAGDYCSPPYYNGTSYPISSIPNATYTGWVHSINAYGYSPGYAWTTVTCTVGSGTCSNGLNYQIYGPSCVCPAGQVQVGTVCQTVSQCTPGYFCSGSNRMYRDASCNDSFVEACAWGCSGGVCLLPPAATLNITASPALVKSGRTTSISWTATNVQAGSCTVTENNSGINDSWTGSSGTQTTSAIVQQTIYTLRCTGADNQIYTDNAVVNIIPVFEEE